VLFAPFSASPAETDVSPPARRDILSPVFTGFFRIPTIRDIMNLQAVKIQLTLPHGIKQEGLAVASIARDDPSTLPDDDPSPLPGMHRDHNAR